MRFASRTMTLYNELAVYDHEKEELALVNSSYLEVNTPDVIFENKVKSIRQNNFSRATD